MSKVMVNILKSEVKKLKYADFKAKTKDEVISGTGTYKDLDRTHNLTINGQEIANKFIKDLYSKHENLITKDETGKDNYRPFLKQIFVEMFEHAGATVPNPSIIEELINNYYQGGYIFPTASIMNQALDSLKLHIIGGSTSRQYTMDCCEPDCLKLSFSMKYTNMCDIDMYGGITCIETHDLGSLVEFKLKYEGENLTYEDGKVSLTIPRELKNYKVDGKNLFDIIVEYFQRACEKLGFKFETKMEHNLGEPMKVIDEPDVYVVNGLKTVRH